MHIATQIVVTCISIEAPAYRQYAETRCYTSEHRLWNISSVCGLGISCVMSHEVIRKWTNTALSVIVQNIQKKVFWCSTSWFASSIAFSGHQRELAMYVTVKIKIHHLVWVSQRHFMLHFNAFSSQAALVYNIRLEVLSLIIHINTSWITSLYFTWFELSELRRMGIIKIFFLKNFENIYKIRENG